MTKIKTVVHLRFQSPNNKPSRHGHHWKLVTSCGHFAEPERVTDDRELVDCRLCKRTREYNQVAS